jgi:hypothetical protein
VRENVAELGSTSDPISIAAAIASSLARSVSASVPTSLLPFSPEENSAETLGRFHNELDDSDIESTCYSLPPHDINIYPEGILGKTASVLLTLVGNTNLREFLLFFFFSTPLVPNVFTC